MDTLGPGMYRDRLFVNKKKVASEKKVGFNGPLHPNTANSSPELI